MLVACSLGNMSFIVSLGATTRFSLGTLHSRGFLNYEQNPYSEYDRAEQADCNMQEGWELDQVCLPSGRNTGEDERHTPLLGLGTPIPRCKRAQMHLATVSVPNKRPNTILT
jgi:hypothetical protein